MNGLEAVARATADTFYAEVHIVLAPAHAQKLARAALKKMAEGI